MGYCLRPTTSLVTNNIHVLSYFSTIQSVRSSETHQVQGFGKRNWRPVPLLRILRYQYHAYQGHKLLGRLTEGVVGNRAQPLGVK